MRLIYTAGVWDLLHRGHLNILHESKKLGDILVVGVVSDRGTKRYKERFPIETQRDRLRAIQAIPWVDVAAIQAETDPSPMLHRYRPDVMTHGDDWDELREGAETIEELGIDWVLIPYTLGVSSSDLRVLGWTP